MTTTRLLLLAGAVLAVSLLLPDLALAASDPFESGVKWFVGGPARGVAMLAVACIAVMAWIFSASLRVVGFVLGGGLVLANVDTIVGWMGF